MLASVEVGEGGAAVQRRVLHAQVHHLIINLDHPSLKPEPTNMQVQTHTTQPEVLHAQARVHTHAHTWDYPGVKVQSECL